MERVEHIQSQEVRTGIGLEAVFGDGGRNEDLQGVAGAIMGASTPAIYGMLPRGLIIPRAAVTPTLDADVNTAVEYAGAEQVAARYHYTDANNSGFNHLPLFLVHTDTDLFVSMPLMQKSVQMMRVVILKSRHVLLTQP